MSQSERQEVVDLRFAGGGRLANVWTKVQRHSKPILSQLNPTDVQYSRWPHGSELWILRTEDKSRTRDAEMNSKRSEGRIPHGRVVFRSGPRKHGRPLKWLSDDMNPIPGQADDDVSA
jgi:hypothetical protein